MNIELTKSQEDYLEAIYIIDQREKNVRIKHISEYLEVKNPSVLKAINILKNKDLVEHHKYGYVFLTEKGKKVAKIIYKKHEIITDFFKKILNVPPDIAEEDACQLEHTIHKITYDRMSKFLEYIENCPKKDEEGPLPKFKYFLKHGRRPDNQ
ncbi:MAG: metal-dependent transcriptional regulator [Candidatus Mcinerneyibacterium aminivorans]|uniref:Metal-dependent transcriptional regulator n=1 Tax=Candidatus Mcinerneyibacterium aminivorans TaxID=2703815 RepID=A0A5D0MIN4_9BACT|nr:MAG: metal-dependent transcriptional regulator [Candidatus Mcinerneyibacterium aminivorans]